MSIDIPSAPTFYPTSKEFADALGYINHLVTHCKAKEYGIVKIVPPKDFKLSKFHDLKNISLRPRLQVLTELSLKNKNMLFSKEKNFSISQKRRHKKIHWSSIVCELCSKSGDEAKLLLCDTCELAYHTYCLTPSLAHIPRGDWLCPQCRTSRMPGGRGFEEVDDKFTLEEFTMNANTFKKNYFNKHPKKVSLNEVEQEFWRLISCSPYDEQNRVVVQYGADLSGVSAFPRVAGAALRHQQRTGGSPMEGEDDDSDATGENSHYFSWNLNKLAVQRDSALRFIGGDISGMKSPWCYAGSCFSCFCWHVEDHWTYSINYNHFGEVKTWYGIPGEDAVKFEKAMRSEAPAFFDKFPSLMHLLSTMYDPRDAMKKGVRVCRAHQHPGEFIITFPRAYHAGFNQGFNFAEAVNFCPPDWMSMGRLCVEHYRQLARPCVFSHAELCMSMATHSDDLSVATLRALLLELDILLRNVQRQLEEPTLYSLGFDSTKVYLRKDMHKLSDEDRSCFKCKTTLYEVAVSCVCSKGQLACLSHVTNLCSCPLDNRLKRVEMSHSLDELHHLRENVANTLHMYCSWRANVRHLISLWQAATRATLNRSSTALVKPLVKVEPDDEQPLHSRDLPKKFSRADIMQYNLQGAARLYPAEDREPLEHILASLDSMQKMMNQLVNYRANDLSSADKMDLEDFRALIHQIRTWPFNFHALETRLEHLAEEVERVQLAVRQLHVRVNTLTRKPVVLPENNSPKMELTVGENAASSGVFAVISACIALLPEVEEVLQKASKLPVHCEGATLLEEEVEVFTWLKSVCTALRKAENVLDLSEVEEVIKNGAHLHASELVSACMRLLNTRLQEGVHLSNRASTIINASSEKYPLDAALQLSREATRLKLSSKPIVELRRVISEAHKVQQKLEQKLIALDNVNTCGKLFYNELRDVVEHAADLPIHFEELARLQSLLDKANAFLQLMEREFFPTPMSSHTSSQQEFALLHVILPRSEKSIFKLQHFNQIVMEKKGKMSLKKLLAKDMEEDEMENVRIFMSDFSQHQDIQRLQPLYKEMGEREKRAMLQLRAHNKRKSQMDEMSGETKSRYCFCSQFYDESSEMVECELCAEWYHDKCLNLAVSNANNSTSTQKSKNISQSGSTTNVIQNFLCPLCERSQRPECESAMRLISQMPTHRHVNMMERVALQGMLERVFQYRETVRRLMERQCGQHLSQAWVESLKLFGVKANASGSACNGAEPLGGGTGAAFSNRKQNLTKAVREGNLNGAASGTAGDSGEVRNKTGKGKDRWKFDAQDLKRVRAHCQMWLSSTAPLLSLAGHPQQFTGHAQLQQHKIRQEVLSELEDCVVEGSLLEVSCVEAKAVSLIYQVLITLATEEGDDEEEEQEDKDVEDKRGRKRPSPLKESREKTAKMTKMERGQTSRGNHQQHLQPPTSAGGERKRQRDSVSDVASVASSRSTATTGKPVSVQDNRRRQSAEVAASRVAVSHLPPVDESEDPGQMQRTGGTASSSSSLTSLSRRAQQQQQQGNSGRKSGTDRRPTGTQSIASSDLLEDGVGDEIEVEEVEGVGDESTSSSRQKSRRTMREACACGEACVIHSRVRVRNVLWVQCDVCTCWYHYMCVGLTTSADIPEEYVCSACELDAARRSTLVDPVEVELVDLDDDPDRGVEPVVECEVEVAACVSPPVTREDTATVTQVLEPAAPDSSSSLLPQLEELPS